MATVTTTAFELSGADGRPLRGDVRTAETGRDRPAVIICHGFKGFKDWGFFPHVALRLARAGMTAVSFNFSGSGIGPDGQTFSEPDRFGHTTFSNDLHDIDTVMAQCRAGDLVDGLARPTRTGLLGHSRGGGTSTLYSAEHHEVSALVTWAAISTVHRWEEDVVERWRRDGKTDIVNSRTGEVLPMYLDVLHDMEQNAGRLDIEAAASTVRCPWLIVHGDADETVDVAEGRRLYAAADPNVSSIEIVEAGSHTFGARHPWAGSTKELDRAMDVTVEWFVSQLL